jgi:hypothetical protein
VLLTVDNGYGKMVQNKEVYMDVAIALILVVMFTGLIIEVLWK